MCVTHFFQTNSITPEWNPNLLPNHLLGNDSDINGQSSIFAGGRRKGTTNRKSGGGNEGTSSFWYLIGPASDFPSAWACCTCQSNTAKSTVKTLWALTWTSLGPVSEPVHCLTEGAGNKGEVLTDLWLSLTSGSEVGGNLPGKFLGAVQLISETKEVQFGMSFFLKPNALGERTIFSLSQSILPLTSCHGHTSNPTKHIPKHSPIFSPLGRSSQFFSLTLLACYSPRKILGKQTMHSFLMKWDNTGSSEISAECPSCVGHSAQAESVLHWLLTLLLADLGLIPGRCSWVCLFFKCLNAYSHNVHKSVMLEKIYPLITQHSQPPSLGSRPSLFKRREKLLWKLPQIFFFSFLQWNIFVSMHKPQERSSV